MEKSELITLDLLGGGSSSVVVGARAKKSAPFRSCHRLLLHPPELNLFPAGGVRNPAPSTPPAPFSGVQSVCTIEQVKRALERAERESRGRRLLRQRRGGEDEGCCSAASLSSSSSSSSSSITTGSNKRPAEAGTKHGDGALVAAGCSGCLSYVLISTDNPRCPRCESQVAPPPPPPPAQKKRPRIDLNFAMSN